MVFLQLLKSLEVTVSRGNSEVEQRIYSKNIFLRQILLFTSIKTKWIYS